MTQLESMTGDIEIANQPFVDNHIIRFQKSTSVLVDL